MKLILLKNINQVYIIVLKFLNDICFVIYLYLVNLMKYVLVRSGSNKKFQILYSHRTFLLTNMDLKL